MGKSRSYEMIEYRKIIFNQILKSKELVKLLGKEQSEYPEDEIPYKYSYPHEFIPDKIYEVDRYINFDISAQIDLRNNTYKDLTIYFFVFCHQEAIHYRDNGRAFLWYDKVTCELDNIFGDKNLLGVGKTSIVSNNPYSPHPEYRGRLLRFAVKDFTNGLRYGK